MTRRSMNTVRTCAAGLLVATVFGGQSMAQEEQGASTTRAPKKANSGRQQDDESRQAELVSLDEMLAIAMKRNPDVRASEAQVRSAEAELDRTRLAVVQKIIAFRERWQSQRGAVRTAELESMSAKRVLELAKSGAVPKKRAELAAAAGETLDIERAKLAEMEAELPFLLGQEPNRRPRPKTTASRSLLEETLLPKTRKLVELQMQAFRTGEAGLPDLIPAHRQLVEIQIRLADTTSQKIKVIEAHRELLQQVRNGVEQSVRAGQSTLAELLAVEIEIGKADLWLLEEKGK